MCTQPHCATLHLKRCTGAKRACRRGEVLLDGVPVTTDTLVACGQTVQLITRARTSARVQRCVQQSAACVGKCRVGMFLKFGLFISKQYSQQTIA